MLKAFVIFTIEEHLHGRLFKARVEAVGTEVTVDIPLHAPIEIHLRNISYNQKALVGKVVKVQVTETVPLTGVVKSIILEEPDLLICFYR